MNTFWIALLLVTEIVIFLIAFNGDWISPSIVTLILFMLSTACCLIGVGDWKNVTFTGKAYLLFSMSFMIMTLVEKGTAKCKIVIGKKSLYNYNLKNSKYIISIKKPFDVILFIIFVFCACYYVYSVIKSGLSLGAAGILHAIGANKEDGDFDTVARLLYNMVRMASYVYVVMLSNNIIVCRQSMMKYKKELLIVLLTILMTMFSGQRSSAICYVVGIVVAVFISVYDHNGGFHKKEIRKYFWKSARVAAALLAVFFLSANIVKNTNIERAFVDYMVYYFGSTTALMGNIVVDPNVCHYPFVGYFGEKTFQGFWDTMYKWGLVSQTPADRKWINMGSHIANRAGNEYTFLCGPYIDFGFCGVLIFVAVFFCFFSYLYYWKIRKYPMSIDKVKNMAIYLFLFVMVIMAFYQDTIRSYSRPINILYVLYIVVFCKIFLELKKVE